MKTIYTSPYPAPCPPTNVSAKHNCTTRKALVRWANVAASTGYSVLAVSNSGQNSSCSDMGTSCQLSDLVCGQQYSVVVEAMTSGCPGPTSAPVSFTTGDYTSNVTNLHFLKSFNMCFFILQSLVRP